MFLPLFYLEGRSSLLLSCESQCLQSSPTAKLAVHGRYVDSASIQVRLRTDLAWVFKVSPSKVYVTGSALANDLLVNSDWTAFEQL